MNIRMCVVGIIAGSALLSGCQSPHVLSMRDGSTIVTKNKPELDDKRRVYRYEDMRGREGLRRAQDVQQVIECDR